MIGTEDIEKLIKLSLFSAYLDGEKAVSLLITARVESGKTELVRKASECARVLYITDLTAWGIQRKYLKQISDGEIRTLIIPDLITPLSKQSSTVETFISFLNNLIEEGVSEVQTYAMSLKLPNPARCNVIACIAKEHLFDRRHRWSKIGFLSRMVPISYEYGPSAIYDIMQSIALRGYKNEADFVDLNLPNSDVEVELPIDVAREIAGLAPHMPSVSPLPRPSKEFWRVLQ